MLHKLLQQAYKIRHKNTINILIYHQVVHEHDPMRPSEPTQSIFDWQMKLLRKYFMPISLDDAVEALECGHIPDNAVVVTFDDGYLNNLTLAQPILEKYQIPATYYISTGFSNGANMWNDRVIGLFANTSVNDITIEGEPIQLSSFEQRRTEAFKQLMKLKYLNFEERHEKVNQWYEQNNIEDEPPLMMTPQQVKELSKRPGATIGAHTVDHPILKVHSEEEQREQIKKSKLVLEEWLGAPVSHFAYPNGKMGNDFDETTIKIAKQCGFKSAVATDQGKCSINTNLFAMPRFTPWDKSPLKFHLRLML